MEREFVIAAFGDRSKQVARLVKNIRSYSDLPINILTTADSNLCELESLCQYHNLQGIVRHFVERLWPNHYRSGQRNGDYYQMKGVLDSKCNSILYLDDDMLIINKDFIQGFELAEKFGICLPLNPRTFVGEDAKIGADVPLDDRIVDIPLATAYNCGTMFVNKAHKMTNTFLSVCSDIILHSPMRGPLAVWKTAERTGFAPYILPCQWCVCQEDVGCHNPIILHCGHEKVRKHYSIGIVILGLDNGTME